MTCNVGRAMQLDAHLYRTRRGGNDSAVGGPRAWKCMRTFDALVVRAGCCHSARAYGSRRSAQDAGFVGPDESIDRANNPSPVTPGPPFQVW